MKQEKETCETHTANLSTLYERNELRICEAILLLSSEFLASFLQDLEHSDLQHYVQHIKQVTNDLRSSEAEVSEFEIVEVLNYVTSFSGDLQIREKSTLH